MAKCFAMTKVLGYHLPSPTLVKITITVPKEPFFKGKSTVYYFKT